MAEPTQYDLAEASAEASVEVREALVEAKEVLAEAKQAFTEMLQESAKAGQGKAVT